MRRYCDRHEAGAALAAHLTHHAGSDPLVLGIPRGGVIVAAEVASALAGSLDVVVARKIVRAATTARPRPRYPVGRGAGSIVLARRLLPDRVFDAAIGTMYR